MSKNLSQILKFRFEPEGCHADSTTQAPEAEQGQAPAAETG